MSTPIEAVRSLAKHLRLFDFGIIAVGTLAALYALMSWLMPPPKSYATVGGRDRAFAVIAQMLGLSKLVDLEHDMARFVQVAYDRTH